MLQPKSRPRNSTLHPIVDVGSDVVPEEVEVAHVPIVAVQPLAHQKNVGLVDPQHALGAKLRGNAAGVLVAEGLTNRPLVGLFLVSDPL